MVLKERDLSFIKGKTMHLITDVFDDSAFREKKIDFTKSLSLEVKSKGDFVIEIQE